VLKSSVGRRAIAGLLHYRKAVLDDGNRHTNSAHLSNVSHHIDDPNRAA
jgi:hypothetical protein